LPPRMPALWFVAAPETGARCQSCVSEKHAETNTAKFDAAAFYHKAATWIPSSAPCSASREPKPSMHAGEKDCKGQGTATKAMRA